MTQRMQKTESSLQVYQGDQFPALAQTGVGELVREVLAPGEYIDVFSLPRVKVPAGGGLVWELPDGTTAKELEGIIVLRQPVRAYWAKPFTGGGTPPDCFSFDTITGTGTPGGACATCPYSKWGSARGPDGQQRPGQACRYITRLFLLRPGSLLPMFIPVPPSSAKAAKAYVTELLASGLPYWHVVTAIGLQRARGRDGIEYSQVTFRKVAEIPPQDRERVNQYRLAITPALQGMPFTEAEAAVVHEDEGNGGGGY